MLKNIIGDWGSGLSDGDYACALAALGVLEATGSEQHRPGSDPAELVAALQEEFRLGERTVVWRKAQNVNKATTAASWRETEHADAAALAAAWRKYRSGIAHPRQLPRLALTADWRPRADLFDFEALCAWLKHRDVGLQALMLADGPQERCRRALALAASCRCSGGQGMRGNPGHAAQGAAGRGVGCGAVAMLHGRRCA